LVNRSRGPSEAEAADWCRLEPPPRRAHGSAPTIICLGSRRELFPRAAWLLAARQPVPFQTSSPHPPAPCGQRARVATPESRPPTRPPHVAAARRTCRGTTAMSPQPNSPRAAAREVGALWLCTTTLPYPRAHESTVRARPAACRPRPWRPSTTPRAPSRARQPRRRPCWVPGACQGRTNPRRQGRTNWRAQQRRRRVRTTSRRRAVRARRPATATQQGCEWQHGTADDTRLGDQAVVRAANRQQDPDKAITDGTAIFPIRGQHGMFQT
jgi:hypothetical protein